MDELAKEQRELLSSLNKVLDTLNEHSGGLKSFGLTDYNFGATLIAIAKMITDLESEIKEYEEDFEEDDY